MTRSWVWPGRAGLVTVLALLGASLPASAGWEAGARAGYDSNVDRSVEEGQGDRFLYGYLTLARETSSERRDRWFLRATLDGAAYQDFSELSYASVALVPGFSVVLGRVWSVTASLLIRGKAVDDNDQSAVAFGGRLGLKQQPSGRYYLGEYYTYTDSQARVETYSFSEHALGLYSGVLWSPRLWTEIGYEFTRGDSYRTLDGDSTAQAGRYSVQSRGAGGPPRFSSAFGKDVVRETVDGHSVAVTAGLDWTSSLTSLVGYTYATARGDLGSSISHIVYLGLAYRH